MPDPTKTDAYIDLALKLAPGVISLIKAASARDNKTFEEVANENGIAIDAEEAALLQDIAGFQAIIDARTK